MTYRFSGDLPDHTLLRSLRIVLKEEPTFYGVMNLFSDIVGQWGIHLPHLFMNNQDHEFLTNDIRINHAHFWSWHISRTYMINSRIAQIPGIDGLVYVHSLADLDERHVIVGFFGR